MSRISRAFVAANNSLVRATRRSCRPEGLLVLFPSCLQNSKCPQKITADLKNCRRCGRCKVKDILALAERYGVCAAIATGGELALQQARQRRFKAIVAVACERELRQGIMSAFPKAVLGIVNRRPNGPCRDTDVDLDQLEGAIRWFLNHDSVDEEQEAGDCGPQGQDSYSGRAA